MNWIKSLWDKVVNKTSVRPTLVVVKKETCTEMFRQMCLDAGVRNKDLRSGKVLEHFEEWYDGPCREESIRECLEEFKKSHPAVNAKLQGKL